MRSPSVAIDMVAVRRLPSRMHNPGSPFTVATSSVRSTAQNFSREAEHQPGNAVGADDRQRCSAGLTASVGCPRGIGRKQRKERLLVSCLSRRHELLKQVHLHGLRDIEALAIASDALAGSVDHLAACCFAPLDHRGDFAIADVEHVVQEEGRPFLGRKSFE